ncbi:PREDICTED: protein SIEVE ELEMENT OCCLUSION B [Tarenaya hassleriana]|uniref:protein SIEVE ELEMENT OCCLUSION B n=1 Tax=Tarenaya hassleriana TaxID=28532 RepID=UPI00053C2AA8|nr:PREDICTED: protein SIEVE ELEMENT OCCLUSION B [Tarenaya hassleriana]
MESLIKNEQARQMAKATGSHEINSTGLTTSGDENVMLKLIQHTHSPDAREFEVGGLLSLVEDILDRATLDADDASRFPASTEDKMLQSHMMSVLDSVSYAVDRVACEIAYKSLTGSDAHQITMSVFEHLSSFHWDGKLVLTLAAFALNYGEFWLLVQFYSKNQLAKSLAMLKLVPVQNRVTLQSVSTSLNDLIREMKNVTRCVVELSELPGRYITPEVPELSRTIASIPIAVYWTIRSVVACIAQINMITAMGHEMMNTQMDSWEVSMLANKLKNIHEHLSETLRLCHRYIEGQRSSEALKKLYALFEATHIDNMKVLKALIYPKDDISPLQDGITKKKVHLDVLRRKTVLLLISDLNISQDELRTFEQIYTDSRKNLMGHDGKTHMPYEVVWIPVVDPIDDYDRSLPLQKKFEALRSTMPWFSVDSPKIIQRHVVKFMRERWHFMNKPILAVLDPQGNEVSLNALHMMWIWGTAAFPFTRTREEELWRGESWILNLVVDGIDPIIFSWIKPETYIFLYGGEDMGWIERFTKAARATATDANIKLEMAYVGKRNHSHREQIRRISETVKARDLSYSWTDPAMMWFFWTRLESMLYSKIQLGKADDHDDVMQGIKKILSYDKIGGWALLSKGEEIVMIAHGAIDRTVSEYDRTWKTDVATKGYKQAIYDHYFDVILRDTGKPCSHFDFHITARSGRIPDKMNCFECHRPMEKYLSFACCHDEKLLRDEENYNF